MVSLFASGWVFAILSLLLPFPPQTQAKGEKAKDWLQTEVQILITDEEQKAYRLLTTDEERERFIEDFWRRRDSSSAEPGAFREEFYRRVAYANENFRGGMPGWKSDRGRIYILYGPPKRRDANPMGGRYQKPFSLGGDTVTTYPFEIWEYDYIQGLGQDISIEFVDRTGSGMYVMEMDPNKKDVFYWRRGEQPLTRIVPRARETPFERLATWSRLQAPPPLKFPDLSASVRTRISYDMLPFDAGAAFVRMSPDLYAVPITVAIANSNLMHVGLGGRFESEIQVYAAVTSTTGEQVYQVDDSFKSGSGGVPLQEHLKLSTYHQLIIPLPPGRYRLSLLIKDVNSEKMGSKETTFWLPAPGDGAINTSSLICADVIQPAPSVNPREEFVLGPLKVVPNLKAVFRQAHRLGLYFEVYDLDVDASSGKPSIEVSYLMESAEGTAVPVGPELESRYPQGHSVAVSKAIPLSTVPPGKYRVAVRVTDRISGRTCTLETQVEIK